MAAFILLHDAFLGPWAWKQIALELRELGQEVHTPLFMNHEKPPASGLHPSPAETYLDNLEHFVRQQQINDAVLVCAGYSGMLGPALAQRAPSAIGFMIFWDAMVPRIGKSCLDVSPSGFTLSATTNTMGPEVRPFLAGPLHRLGCRSGNTDTLSCFPRQALTEKYAGPPKDQWPQSVYLHTPLEESPTAPVSSQRAQTLGMDYHSLDLDEHPVLARAQEVARSFVGLAVPVTPRNREGCGANPMPHEMRMNYCARYRRRHSFDAISKPAELA